MSRFGKSTFIKEYLFWLHTLMSAFAVIMGFYFSFYTMMIIVTLHQLHFKVFKGCVITILQRKAGDMDPRETFFQHFLRKIFKRDITLKQDRWIMGSIYITGILVAGLRTFAL